MRYLIILFACFTILSCKQEVEETIITPEQEEVKIGFIHNVYFWLKKDADPEIIETFKSEALPALAEVSSIQKVYWGPPAMTDRSVVDNSYDVAWITMFADSAGHEAYQIDPIHLKFVEEYSDIFEKVAVYDNEVK